MSEFQVEVRITPRQGLLDPEGKAVENALRSLGFEDAKDVKIGRLVRLKIEAESAEAAGARADEMCKRLLANPVTEDYEVEVKG